MSDRTGDNAESSASDDVNDEVSDDNAVTALRPGRLKSWSGTALRVSARALAGLVLALFTFAVLGWLALQFVILPHIERWRPQIEERASTALGVAVRIGHIDVRSSGLSPLLDLQDVVLLDVVGREALRLPKVSAMISARSLLSMQLRFSQLRIEGAALDLRRDSQDRLFVAGLELGASSGAGSGDTSAVDWFFRQREFVIQNGSITWTDERRNAPALSLTDVDVVVRNGLFSHDMQIDATPPPDWGDRFSLRGRFTQGVLARSGDWARWSGEAYVDFPRADARQLRQRVTLPFQLDEGEGALRAWIDLRQGEVRRATVDVAVRTVAMRLNAAAGAPPLAPLAFDELRGRFVALRDKERSSLAVQQFGFVTNGGQQWPRSDMSLAWDGPADAPSRGGVFTAQRLDLALMAQVADGLPFDARLRQHLAEYAPRGVVSGLQLNWAGPVDAPRRYQLKASVSDLALQAGPLVQPPPPTAATPLGHHHALGRPGFRNVSLELSATERGGDADVSMVDGAIDLPGAFDEPQVPIDKLTTRLSWRMDGTSVAADRRQVQVQMRNLRFANGDAEGEADATWRMGLLAPVTGTPGAASAAAGPARAARPGVESAVTGHLGALDLNGRLTRGKADRVFRYLPAELPFETRHYIDRAVRSGTIDSATFKVKGDLADFPFHRPKPGEFRVELKARDVRFDYVPAGTASGPASTSTAVWPAIDGLSGDLVFDRTSMELRNLRGQVYGIDVSNASGGIADLSTNPVLTLDAQARGPMSDLLRFVRVSPLGEWTGRALDEAVVSGAGEFGFALRLPLNEIARATVKGQVNLAGNDVRFGADIPALQAARGRVDFTEHGFAVANGSARVLGGEASFDGGSQPDGSLRFNGQGTATAEALRRAPELGFVSRLATTLQGQAAYKMALGFVMGRSEIDITSNLVGFESTLPAPLRKPAAQPLPLRYQTRLQAESGSQATAATPPARDVMTVDLGNIVRASYQRELSATGSPKVLRGGIGVMEAAPVPESGVAASVHLAGLDIDAWQTVVDQLMAPPSVSDLPVPTLASPVRMNASGVSRALEAPARESVREGGREAEAARDDEYLPDSVALRVDELAVGTRKLTHVVAGLSRRDAIWRANLDADQLNGYAEYRPPGSIGGPTGVAGTNLSGLVYARLARLALPESEVTGVETLLDQQPISMPALDIVIDDFELRGMRLGKLDIEASNRSRIPRVPNPQDPASREWTLSRLNVVSPDGQLSATGAWAPVQPQSALANGAPSGPRRTSLDFKLDVSNGGDLLDRLGFQQVVKGAKGALSGQVSWLGSPLSIDYPSMDGSVKVAFQQGQFLKVNPGAARLLGVLSLQALPRRLSLDFRDLFQQGFAFDSVMGDLVVKGGVATTNNLRMRGVQAAVLMAGSADLKGETQDLRVVVVPEINAGTAALAYAVINPAIGLGTFLAQMFLKQPLTRAGTREFHISGSWEDPKIDRVARGFDDPIPDFKATPDPPSAAASGPASGATAPSSSPGRRITLPGAGAGQPSAPSDSSGTAP